MDPHMDPHMDPYVDPPPWASFVKSDTVEGRVVELGYELTNARMMAKRAWFQMVVPRYRMNHRVHATLEGLYDAFDLRGHLENYCSRYIGHYIDILKLVGDVIPVLTSCEPVPFIHIFYTKRLMHKGLDGTPYPPRERPLPNALPPRDKAYLCTTLARYSTCLDKIVRFVDEMENNYGTLRADTLAAVDASRKQVQRAMDLMNI